MKKSKFSLILALFIVLALITPFVTYATAIDEQGITPTSEEAGEPMPISEENGEPMPISDTDATEPISDNPDEQGTAPENGEDNPSTEGEGNGDDTEGTEGDDVTNPIADLEEVKGNYFEANTNVVFNKAVDGNIFLTGDKVTIQGMVNGDAFICASEVVLEKDAKILGNVFLIAENFTHSGLVYNLYAAVENYTCDYDGLTALDLKVFAKNIKFSGYAERSVYFSADTIELTDDAYIVGHFVYDSNNEPTIAEKATIYGEKMSSNMFSIISGIDDSNPVIEHIVSVLALLATVLLLLLVVNFFKPSTLSKNLQFNFVKCLKALGIGLLSFIVLSIAIIVLLITGIFATFSAILLMGFILALILSSFIVIIATSIMLYNKFNNDKSKWFVVLYAVLVSLVYYALTIIPIAGGIISIIIGLTGFGFIVLWLYNIRKTNKISDGKESEKKEVKETSKKDSKKSDKSDKNTKSDK